MAESMNKLFFAGAATLAGALVLSHGTAFADDNPEMNTLLRSSAKYNYQIVDDAGLKPSETAKAARGFGRRRGHGAAPSQARRQSRRQGVKDRSVEPRRRLRSRGLHSVRGNNLLSATGAGGPLDRRLHRPQRRRRVWKPPEHPHVGLRHLRLSPPFQRLRFRLERDEFDRARRIRRIHRRRPDRL